VHVNCWACKEQRSAKMLSTQAITLLVFGIIASQLLTAAADQYPAVLVSSPSRPLMRRSPTRDDPRMLLQPSAASVARRTNDSVRIARPRRIVVGADGSTRDEGLRNRRPVQLHEDGMRASLGVSMVELVGKSLNQIWPFEGFAEQEKPGEESQKEEEAQHSEERNQNKAEDQADQTARDHQNAELKKKLAADEKVLERADRKYDPEDEQLAAFQVMETFTGDVLAGVREDGTFSLKPMLQGLVVQAEKAYNRTLSRRSDMQAKLTQGQTDYRGGITDLKARYRARRAALRRQNAERQTKAAEAANMQLEAARRQTVESARTKARQDGRLNSLTEREALREQGHSEATGLLEWLFAEERKVRSGWQATKAEYRKWERLLRQGHFRAKAIPLVTSILKPHLLGGISGVSLDPAAAVEAGATAIAGEILSSTTEVAVLQGHLATQLEAALGPPMQKALAALRSTMWAGLDASKNSASAALCQEVGAVPNVGGIFAPTLEAVFNQVYARAREGMNLALARFTDSVQRAVIEGMTTVALECIDPAAARPQHCRHSPPQVPSASRLSKAGEAVAWQVVGNMREAYEALSNRAAGASEQAVSAVVALVTEDQALAAAREKDDDQEEESTQAPTDNDEAANSQGTHQAEAGTSSTQDDDDDDDADDAGDESTS